MRPFLLLLVGLLLAGVGQGVLAESYRYVDNLGWQYHSVRTPDCYSVAQNFVENRNAVTMADSGGASTTYFWDGECSGSLSSGARTVTFVMQYRSGGVFGTLGSPVLYFDSVVEDADTDEVSGIPLQRVAVLIGSFLMFGIGWIAGK